MSASRFLEPNDKTNHLLALELTWDLGFAELTSATGASKFESFGQRDQTDFLMDLDYGYEDFPQFAAYATDDLEEETFNQELRLVSQGTGKWNWIVGAFYNRYEGDGVAAEYTPRHSGMVRTARRDSPTWNTSPSPAARSKKWRCSASWDTS